MEMYNYENSFTSFSPSDIIATITIPNKEPVVIGSLNSISYSIYRSKFPVLGLGRITPKGFTRGARTITGTLNFMDFNQSIVFDLMKEMKENGYKIIMDEMPMFDVTVTLANEFGERSTFTIYGVTSFTESKNITVKGIEISTFYEFFALDITPLTSLKNKRTENEDKKNIINNVNIDDEKNIKIVDIKINYINITNIEEESFTAEWAKPIGYKPEYMYEIIVYKGEDIQEGMVFREVITNNGLEIKQNVTGLKAWTDYNVMVRVINEKGEFSEDSPIRKTKTADKTKPVLPGFINWEHIKEGNINRITWDEATDNGKLSHYEIFLNDTYVNRTIENKYDLLNLEELKNYNIKIKAIDEAGNESIFLEYNFTTNDYLGPKKVENLREDIVESDKIKIKWDRSEDASGILKYKIKKTNPDFSFENFETIETEYIFSGLEKYKNYKFKVIAVDNAGNEGREWSDELQVKTLDNSPPSAPELATEVLEISVSGIKIMYKQSEDSESGIKEHQVLLNGILKETIEYSEASSSMVIHEIKDLMEGSSYSITLKGVDNSGNVSAESNQNNVSSYIKYPSFAKNVRIVGSRSSNSAKITWDDAENDGSGIKKYIIKRTNSAGESLAKIELSGTEKQYTFNDLNPTYWYKIAIYSIDNEDKESYLSTGSFNLIETAKNSVLKINAYS
jgi:disulfide oxidoreductase YuzD